MHCTQKLLKEIGTATLVETSADTRGLGNWYVNILRIERKKCLLFTNEKTLYSFLIPNVKKSNIKNIVDEFLINMSFNLQAEGFDINVINKLMQEYHEIGFGKTASKQILGWMNQIAFEYEIRVQMKEGLGNVRIIEANKEINRSLRSILNGKEYFHPIEALQQLISEDFQ